MTDVAPEREALRAPDSSDPAFRDALTFSFGDLEAGVCGVARVGVGAAGVSGLAVVYAGGEPVAASSARRVAAEPVGSWDELVVAGVRCTVQDPLAAWGVRYEGGAAGFDLRFEALSAPAVLAADGEVARVGGFEGYEQLCGVTGTVRHGGRSLQVRCFGQRGHEWGAPDWERIELTRSLCAWMGADRAVTLSAVRPERVRGHDGEAMAAWTFERGEPIAVFEPRLSTTYDGAQRHRRAGLELWMDEEGGLARRAAGVVLCGTTVDLGDLRLETAFFEWRMERRVGVGRYDVLRRVADGDGGGGGGGGRRGSRTR